MNSVRLPALYLAMLAAHIAHVFEEVWAGFRLIDVLGLGGFLVANWLLWIIPASLFVFILRGRRWAYRLGMLYAAVMLINGIAHNVMTVITRHYFGAFAGGFTGIALILVAPFLIAALRREQPPPRIRSVRASSLRAPASQMPR